jgi:hypothetical protein
MPSPMIHGRRGFVTASSLLGAAGAALTAIKKEDHMTWKDVGEAIGVGDDQAAKYGDGISTMNFITFIRACQCWNGRFANSVFGLSDLHLSESAKDTIINDIRRGMLAFSELMVGLQRAMLDDELDENELEELGSMIETAGAFLDQLRNRLANIRASGKYADKKFAVVEK